MTFIAGYAKHAVLGNKNDTEQLVPQLTWWNAIGTNHSANYYYYIHSGISNLMSCSSKIHPCLFYLFFDPDGISHFCCGPLCLTLTTNRTSTVTTAKKEHMLVTKHIYFSVHGRCQVYMPLILPVLQEITGPVGSQVGIVCWGWVRHAAVTAEEEVA